jgi:hypothetical protein
MNISSNENIIQNHTVCVHHNTFLFFFSPCRCNSSWNCGVAIPSEAEMVTCCTADISEPNAVQQVDSTSTIIMVKEPLLNSLIFRSHCSTSCHFYCQKQAIYSIPPLFRYSLRPAVLLPLLLAGQTLGRPTNTLGMSCLQSHFASSSVVGGSEHVISYCAEEHGGRGVYLNKGGIEYRVLKFRQ